AKGPPALPILRPIDVAGSLAMAGLASDADFRPGCLKAVFGRGVIFLHASGMALRAHEISVLIQLRPMQYVVMPDALVGIEMVPSLTAGFLRPAVPGDR